MSIHLKILYSKIILLAFFTLNHSALQASKSRNKNSTKLLVNKFIIDHPLTSSESLPECVFLEKNTCQSAGSGGHANSIFTTKDGYCAKKIRGEYVLKEVDFYEKIHKECPQYDEKFKKFCDYIPKFYGICKNGRDFFIKMENVKNISNSSTLESIKSLDLKIGTHTASKVSLKMSNVAFFERYFWLSIHFFQDRFLTSSRRLGYRFAGGVFENKKIGLLHYLNRLSYHEFPEKSLNKFLETQQRRNTFVKCFYYKLNKLEKLIMHSEFTKFHLVGSSILLVYDENPSITSKSVCSVHMIDFANSFIIGKNDKRKLKKNRIYANYYKKGILNLSQKFSKILNHN